MTSVNVLLASAGRRPYLVRWFQDAFCKLGVQGRVIAADADPLAATKYLADVFLVAPPIVDAGYRFWLEQTLEVHSIDLALSVNDFELSKWSTFPAEPTHTPKLIRLGSREQEFAEDKLALAKQLDMAGIQSPPTWSGRRVLEDSSLISDIDRFVVKHRFGSGSAGLAIVDRPALFDTIQEMKYGARDRHGAVYEKEQAALDAIVVQPEICGTEYGVDIVSDLRGHFRGTLARRKISMRHGETDKAVTVHGGPFEGIGRGVAGVFGHRGLIDTDVIEDDHGCLWLIDVNPRFGGGYPFSHLAGADVPSALIAWQQGLPDDLRWLAAEENVTSAKSVDVVRLGANV